MGENLRYGRVLEDVAGMIDLLTERFGDDKEASRKFVDREWKRGYLTISQVSGLLAWLERSGESKDDSARQ